MNALSRSNLVWICERAYRRALAALLLAFLAAGLAWAQAPPAGGDAPSTTDAEGYKVLIPSATLATNKLQEAKVKAIVFNVLKGNAGLNENRVIFDAYFAKFYFPMRTQTTPEALADLPIERHRFFRDYLEACSVPEVHAHLADMTLSQMQMIVDDNFHPTVRYNAMFIISSLNDQEKVVIGASKGTPEPMLRALPVILDEFNKPTNTDAIRVAALLGLVRHLEWDNFKSGPPIPQAQKAAVVKTLLDLALQRTPPAGRDAEGQQWFRRRAIEGLAHASYTQVQPAVADAIEKLLMDDTEVLAVRCAAAAAVGKMTYQAPVKLDAMPMARELGFLALVSCDHELTRVANMKKLEDERAARLAGEPLPGAGGVPGPETGRPAGGPRPPAGGDLLGGPGGGIFTEDPKQYRFDPLRRRIRADLYCVQVGLTGGDDKTQTARGVEKVAKTPEEKDYVANIKAAVDRMAKTLEDAGGLDLAGLEKDLRSQIKTLEGMTRKLGAAAIPAAVEGPGEVPAPAPPAPVPAPPPTAVR